MNYEESRVYLDDAAKYGSVLGLDNMRELLNRLGNPQDESKFIHIGGTNGKGSVLAYLSTILKESGYRVGRYISPTLFSYRERIQINESYIKKDSLARLTTQIRGCIDEMVKEGKAHPTAFEIETALCFLYFREENCDLVTLEVGMGGDLDATNVITTAVMEVLASISRDHMGFLGNTLGEIAACKAGIIKPGTLVVSASQAPEAMEVIRDKCKREGSRLRIADADLAEDVMYGCEKQRFSYKEHKALEISLAGYYQIANAVLAVEAVDGLRSLGYDISEEALRRGFANTVWKGRFTVLQKKPYVIIDGAHNQAAAEVLVKSIRQYFPDRKLHYIMGVFRDKEYEEIIRLTAPYAASVTTIETPGNPRALPAEELAECWKRYHRNVTCEKDIKCAVKKKLQEAEKDEVILAFGSLSFLREIEKALMAVRSEV